MKPTSVEPQFTPAKSTAEPPPPVLKSNAALWRESFPDVPLTEPRWIERISREHLEKALQIAQAEDRAGRFPVRDQENIGRYVSRVASSLKNGRTCDGSTTTFTFPVTIAGGYQFSDRDKRRFKNFLRPDGACLRWTGAKNADGYGRFKVNGKAISAHYVAFFMESGCLPLAGELDGQKFNVSHSCRNPNCCNPRHLRLKTKRVNLEEREYSTTNSFHITSVQHVQPLGNSQQPPSLPIDSPSTPP